MDEIVASADSEGHRPGYTRPLTSRQPPPAPVQFGPTVITGFNTDVKHGTRVFHIQTEDKGEPNPYIESLIYVGGEILASKRTSYAEVLKDTKDGPAIHELMEQQHRTMIAAIQRGRFDGPNGSLRVPDDLAPRRASEAAVEPALPSLSPAPARAETGDRTLDQMVLDYLASEEQLELTLSPVPELVAGRAAEFRVKAETSPSHAAGIRGRRCRCACSRPSPGRRLSSRARRATTAPAPSSSPSRPSRTGNAAAVVRVTSASGSTEVKCSVKRKA